MRPIRVLHCPDTVGGNAAELARVERELGLKSWAVSFDQYYLGYEIDEVLRSQGEKRIAFERKRWALLWRALKDFDIIHFNFGLSIFSNPRWYPRSELQQQHLAWPQQLYKLYSRLIEMRDLPLLKRAGKGIVVTYQGDDARQGDFCRTHFEINPAAEVGPDYYWPARDAYKRYRIDQFARYADRIYALNPDLCYVLPPQTQFLPYAHIDLRKWQAGPKPICQSAVPVIVHAPTNRGVKGTRFVLEAISRLQAEGVALEFMLIEGLSHAEARTLYERADLLVDQLLVGWYGGLAVELMALGKPVICYIRQDDLKFIPSQMQAELPVLQATPVTIYDVLKQWLTIRKCELPEVGRRSRAYVEKWHDSLQIADQLKHEYEAIIASKTH